MVGLVFPAHAQSLPTTYTSSHPHTFTITTTSTLQLKDLSAPAWAMGPTITAQDGPLLLQADLGG